MTPQEQQELGELINALLDEGLSDEGRLRLEQLLRDDREAQQYYIEQCQLHSILAWEHGVLSATLFDSQATPPPKQEATSGKSLYLWKLCALAATILFLATFAWNIYLATTPKTPAEPPQIATSQPMAPSIPWTERKTFGAFSKSRGAQLSVPELLLELRQGDLLRSGRYQLSEGFAEIVFNNNVEVLVESPAEFDIVSDMKLVMHRGRISTIVSPEGEGFKVETPSIELTDFGTEFAVEVSPDRTSEVHVFSGEVKVTPKLAYEGMERLQLVTNQATRVRQMSGIPEGIDIDRDRFLRRLNETTQQDIGYEQRMLALKPAQFFQMAPTADGVTLADHGSRKSDGILLKEGMDQPPFKPGRVGSSLYLGGPGTLAYAKVPHYQPSETGTISVCAWVKAESRPHWAAIAKHWAIEFDEQDQPSGLGGQFHFGLHEYGGGLEVQVRDQNKNVVKLREAEPLPLGQWQHVAFVVDGQQVRLYRNGAEVASAKCDGLATDGPEAMGIGAKLSPDCTQPDLRNPGYWHGRIDELAIFDRALTPAELTELSEMAPR
ncbi:FecR domain-containing protein [Blastopirellula sp. JC732]|uniref:FecR domain-containing protein n=1 Tax=Blastopirellula sediminis TaxID=2894196 RepID=A0A9X1SGW1_9BACT|nr:LamG-like jellyroll fold domain-containing protein [Blastopirellula sediminis]MCC9606121.1 FecR domain-containing protein [Blastopirellula sediminis]MCC9630580.1 FecR domain-containing protein [Blastopirellula sediminis]